MTDGVAKKVDCYFFRALIAFIESQVYFGFGKLYIVTKNILTSSVRRDTLYTRAHEQKGSKKGII